MSKLLVGILIGFLAASTLAWAVTVKFPSTLKIRGVALVDEAGNILGGVTPTAVEVVNAATSFDVNVTSLPAGLGSGARTVVTTYGADCPGGFSAVYTGSTYGWGAKIGNGIGISITSSDRCHGSSPSSIAVPEGGGAGSIVAPATALVACAVCIED